MIFPNDDSLIFATYNGAYTKAIDEVIYIHNVINGADDLLKIIPTPRPRTFIDKLKKKISPSARYEEVSQDEKIEVLSTPYSYVVEIDKPGTANLCFVDSHGHINNGVCVSVTQDEEDIFGSTNTEILVSPIKHDKLVELTKEKEVFIMPKHAFETSLAPETIDCTPPLEMN